MTDFTDPTLNLSTADFVDPEDLADEPHTLGEQWFQEYQGTWHEQPLAVEPDEGSEPVLFQRTDGVALIYPGKLHAFNGEPEAGKSWLAMLACAQETLNGNHVVYIDFEDGPRGQAQRAAACGADLSLLHYIRPESPVDEPTVQYLIGLCMHYEPTLVVLDGLAEALVSHQKDENSNAEVTEFMENLPRQLVRQAGNPAVVIIDHLAKNAEGRYARGAGAKLAGMDGAVFLVKVGKRFGRNLAGFSKVEIAKDRPGYLREHGKVIAALHTDGEGGWTLEAPAAAIEGETETRIDPARWLLLQAMRSLPNQAGSIKDIVAAGGPAASTCYKLVPKLLESGDLLEVGGGTSKFDPRIFQLPQDVRVSTVDPETGEVVS